MGQSAQGGTEVTDDVLAAPLGQVMSPARGPELALPPPGFQIFKERCKEGRMLPAPGGSSSSSHLLAVGPRASGLPCAHSERS